MKIPVVIACSLLAGVPAAATSKDCKITAVRERVLPEGAGGPQRPREEGEAAPPSSIAGVFHVAIACGRKRFYAVFTGTSKFNRTDFDTGRAIRVNIDDGNLRIENREGAHATGRLTADRQEITFR